MKRLLALAAVLCACQTVPYTNRPHLMLVTVDQELALGESSYKQALGEAKLSGDRASLEMIRRVGARLAAVSEHPEYKWEFNLIEDPKTVNAWCMPGGKVAVYSGLLPISRDENGLAVVLGHEISHALARHGSERMSQGMLANLGGTALDALMQDKPSATRDLARQAYGAGAQVGVLLPFSRAQESEADHIGLILMAKAGYDPETAVGFWERMARNGGASGGPLDRFLRTHPTDADRVAKIKDELPEARSYYKR